MPNLLKEEIKSIHGISYRVRIYNEPLKAYFNYCNGLLSYEFYIEGWDFDLEYFNFTTVVNDGEKLERSIDNFLFNSHKETEDFYV